MTVFHLDSETEVKYSEEIDNEMTQTSDKCQWAQVCFVLNLLVLIQQI